MSEKQTTTGLAIKTLIDEAYKQAIMTLKKRQKDLKAGAKLLADKETVTPDEFPPLKQKATLSTKNRASTSKTNRSIA